MKGEKLLKRVKPDAVSIHGFGIHSILDNTMLCYLRNAHTALLKARGIGMATPFRENNKFFKAITFPFRKVVEIFTLQHIQPVAMQS